jgi:hypothetical protein
MVWALVEHGQEWTWLGIGCAGHGLSWAWTGLGLCPSAHGLGCAVPWMGLAGHGLGWTWAGHGLYWLRASLDMGLSLG